VQNSVQGRLGNINPVLRGVVAAIRGLSVATPMPVLMSIRQAIPLADLMGTHSLERPTSLLPNSTVVA